jgi:hypothetical protein
LVVRNGAESAQKFVVTTLNGANEKLFDHVVSCSPLCSRFRRDFVFVHAANANNALLRDVLKRGE